MTSQRSFVQAEADAFAEAPYVAHDAARGLRDRRLQGTQHEPPAA